jgi:hypothetical protein
MFSLGLVYITNYPLERIAVADDNNHKERNFVIETKQQQCL